jgi:hypothetical protein
MKEKRGRAIHVTIIYGSLHCRIKSCRKSMRRVMLWLTDRLNGNTSVFGVFEDASEENLHHRDRNTHCLS